MSEHLDEKSSIRPCPSCGANIKADINRQKNFRRWSIAAFVLLMIGLIAFALRAILTNAGHDAEMRGFSVGCICAVAVLRGGYFFWRVRK